MNNPEKFLDAAQKIGTHICQTAYWYQERCNWIGKGVEEIAPLVTTIYNKSLGSDVYDGTGGIAFFLSYLYGIKKEECYRKLAEGAINHALSKVNELPVKVTFSFFTGKLGVAYVSSHIGRMLNENVLIEKAIDILKELGDNINNKHLMDVISGNASGIPALLELYKIFQDEKILNLAVLLGDELIDVATKEPHGWSWNYRANSISSAHNLTGFSHGAAGIGFSLLELYNTLKDTKFLEAARNAFSYENNWFSKQENNWPDFRSESKDSQKNSKFTYAIAWCHGAPGIGLSRLRAYDLIKDEQCFSDSMASIKTSMYTLQQIINIKNDPGSADFSLCHGLSGLCETLLYATKILQDKRYKLLAEKVGLYGIEKYDNKNLPWPCGLKKGGETPGLMLGLAGIGHFYLQLSDAIRVPNPLILTPTI